MRTEGRRLRGQGIFSRSKSIWPHNWDRNEKISLIIAALVFGYTCLRAALLSITHDEALTYLIHVSGSLQEIFAHSRNVGSNNHLLNTLLIKFISGLFGNSEFVLRIPALIGHVIYLIATFKILALFLKGKRFLIGFALMATNPLLLDFFSCARGYSIAIGFFLLSLYFLYRGVQFVDFRYQTINNYLVITMLTFSVLSNLGFATVYVPVIAILIIREVKNHFIAYKYSHFELIKRLSLSLLLPFGASAVCLSLIYTPSVINIIRAGTKDWGGVDGFWVNTVTSIVEGTLYGQTYATPGTVTATKIWIFFVLLIAFVLAYMCLLIKGKPNQNSVLLLQTVSLICGVALIIQIQYVLFQIKYPIDRGALYLIPLFFLIMLLVWEYLAGKGYESIRMLSAILGYGIAALLLLNSLLCFNITHYYLWQYDAATKEAMKIIYDLSRPQARFTDEFSIGINWLFEPSTNYYILKNRIAWIQWTNRTGPDGLHDYYYLLESDREVIEKNHLRLIRSFDISHSYIALPPVADTR